jgi:hypothetical protein
VDITHARTARKRLPNRRASKTFSMEVAGLGYTATVSRFPDSADPIEQIIAAKFGNESPEQIEKHRRIAQRHRGRRYDTAPLIPRLRVLELERFFVHAYGARSLPDDDAGRADLRLMADHLAQIDPRRIRIWAADWLPEITDAETDALIAEIGACKRWQADPLGRALGLDDATRTKLKIRTIGAVDCTKAQRKARRRRKRIAADRARRAAAGARPHAQSAENLMPWIAAGISRASYYRRQRAQKIAAGETAETETRPVPLTSHVADQSHEAPGGNTEASGSSFDPGEAHGGQTSNHTAKPLPLSIHADRSSVETGLDQIAGLDPFERARRQLQAAAEAVVRSPNSERLQHLMVAASSAFTRAKTMNAPRPADTSAACGQVS